MQKVSQDYCPYLGLAGDKDLHCLFPDATHRCYRDGTKMHVDWEQQERVCLKPDHVGCAYVATETSRKARLLGVGGAILLATSLILWTAPTVKLPVFSTNAIVRPSPTSTATGRTTDAKSAPGPATERSETPVSLILTTGAPSATDAKPPAPRPTVTLAQSVTPAVATPTTTSSRTHLVASGETLSTIATRYDTSVDALVRVNKLTNRNFVTVGQRLVIP